MDAINLSPTTKEFRFHCKEDFEFQPGQFVMLSIDGNSRAFSIASAPHEKNLEFIIKRHEGGAVTPKLYELKTGNSLEFLGPYGVFTVKDKSKDLVFLAGGTGIAPFRGMVRNTLRTNKNARITLIYGFSMNCIEEDEWAKLSKQYKNFKLHICCSIKKKDWNGPVCNVNEILDKILVFSRDKRFYICGPDIMIKVCKEDLMKKLKFKESQIFTEPWPHPTNKNN